MADEEIEENGEEGEAKKSGGMMKIILLVNGLLLVIGLIVGTTLFLMGGMTSQYRQTKKCWQRPLIV